MICRTCAFEIRSKKESLRLSSSTLNLEPLMTSQDALRNSCPFTTREGFFILKKRPHTKSRELVVLGKENGRHGSIPFGDDPESSVSRRSIDRK